MRSTAIRPCAVVRWLQSQSGTCCGECQSRQPRQAANFPEHVCIFPVGRRCQACSPDELLQKCETGPARRPGEAVRILESSLLGAAASERHAQQKRRVQSYCDLNRLHLTGPFRQGLIATRAGGRYRSRIQIAADQCHKGFGSKIRANSDAKSGVPQASQLGLQRLATIHLGVKRPRRGTRTQPHLVAQILVVILTTKRDH